jgi:hypothetical protein
VYIDRRHSPEKYRPPLVYSVFEVVCRSCKIRVLDKKIEKRSKILTQVYVVLIVLLLFVYFVV